MRAAADAIEKGDRGNIQAVAAVAIDDAGAVVVWGWGRTFDVHTVGLLHVGAAWIASRRTER
jgi:hypothetical protein